MTDLEMAIVRFDGNGNEPYADLIVEALRKQIPMSSKRIPFSGCICPSCNINVEQVGDFCEWCGQHLKYDWE